MISAIIVTYRVGAPLSECLRAALADDAIGEIVLVDNAETPEHYDDPGDSDARVKLIRGHGNIGFARGCNRGAAHASGTHLLFLNPDAIIAPGAATHLQQTLTTARAPAIAGGRLLDANDKEQRGDRRDQLTLWRAIVTATPLRHLEPLGAIFRDMHRERDPLPSVPIETGAVSGALMMLTREGFAQLGGFDEGYFLHVEDIDLCRRARDAGGVVLFDPAASARHIGGASGAPRAIVQRHKADGFVRYFNKFASSPIERALIALAMTLARPLLALRR